MSQDMQRWTIDISDTGGQALSWRSDETSRERAMLRAVKAASAIAAIAGIELDDLRVTGTKAVPSGAASGLDWITSGTFGAAVLAATSAKTITEDEATNAVLSLMCADPALHGDEDDPRAMLLATAEKALSVGGGAFCAATTDKPGAPLRPSPQVLDAFAAIGLGHAIGLNLGSEHKLFGIGPSRAGSATHRAILSQRYRSRSREGIPETLAMLDRIGASAIAQDLRALMGGDV